MWFPCFEKNPELMKEASTCFWMNSFRPGLSIRMNAAVSYAASSSIGPSWQMECTCFIILLNCALVILTPRWLLLVWLHQYPSSSCRIFFISRNASLSDPDCLLNFFASSLSCCSKFLLFIVYLLVGGFVLLVYITFMVVTLQSRSIQIKSESHSKSSIAFSEVSRSSICR